MPALDKYNWEKVDQLEEVASAETGTRTKVITALWTYYEGNHRKPLKVRKGQPDDNVIVNICARIVDQSSSLLFGTPFQIELNETEETPEEGYLDEIWERNKYRLFFLDLGTMGGVEGHCFIKIQVERPFPRLILLPSSRVTAFWDPDDLEKVLAYRIAWKSGKLQKRQHIIRMEQEDGTSLHWMIRDLEKVAEGPGGSWQWRETALEAWRYEFPPLLDWKNLPNPKEYYGASDLKEVVINDAVNFLASNTQRIIKYHAHPKTIGIGARAQDLVASDVAGVWFIGNKDARVENLEMRSDLSSSLSWLRYLMGYAYSRHQTVDLVTLQDRIGRITNFGLRVLYKDALDKLGTKQLLYEEAIKELCRRLLILAGKADPESVVLHWGDPLPYNDKEEVEGLQKEMEMGILSKKTAAEIRGRDWELEQERMAAEQGEMQTLGEAILTRFEQDQEGRGQELEESEDEEGEV